jgi:imidazolonepropionase-like amidohydrolase
MKNRILLLAFLLILQYAGAQFKPDNGVKDSKPEKILLTNATIYISPKVKLEKANLLIQGNRILDVFSGGKKYDDVVQIDCSSKVILPAFIELNSNVGMPKGDDRSFRNTFGSKGSLYWNEAIHPEVEASRLYEIDAKSNENYQKMGFGFALSHIQDGIARGTGVLMSLGNQSVNKQTIKTSAAQYYSFSKGSSSNGYPSSQMGSIALLRQAFYDLKYYSETVKKTETSISMEKWFSNSSIPSFFQVDDKWEILRAQKIAKEFNVNFSFLGSGNEYLIAKDLKKYNLSVVISLNFPEAYDVKDPYIARQVPLSDLKHWELAPSNAKLLSDQGVKFCFSSAGIKTIDVFWTNLRKTISRGLKTEDALAALTTNPAELIGMQSEFGTLDKGKLASFTVYSSDPFTTEAKLLESWLIGERTIFSENPSGEINGSYSLNIAGNKYTFQITGSPEKPQGSVQTFKTIPSTNEINGKKVDTLNQKATILRNSNDLTIQFNVNDDLFNGSINLHGKVKTDGVFEGDGTLPNGSWIQWSAIRIKEDKEESKFTAIKLDTSHLVNVWYPNLAFGFDSLPKKNLIYFKNATVWTNEKEGIIANANVLVENGKIIGVNTVTTPPKNAIVIDANGKHLTSGIIDEHSHIAISKGVNEGGQAISAEVSIADVVNPDDINIYRQLAGGVTAAQLLHGSANPIGGQSALIKLKWGHAPDEMVIPNSPKFIKCALGENVKQSNWGDNNRFRFPQTRMGVEQVFYDGFLRAQAYKKEWENYYASMKVKGVTPPRKDLELEVLLEILEKKRFITCHSYVQSEINMLMHLADSLDFKVNTFTHILEGYKIADKMKKHGVGGSTFSDWWAYKYEVNEAIPYNAKMMADQGVVVAINSDDAEMGRRLNQEAAKSVKYGGMSEEEAWKLVTLNPAKLLHLDDRMGSIKSGKDADLVLWSDNPLSINAKVAMTLVDGMILYDASESPQREKRNESEKARIINRMLESNEKGEPVKPFVKKGKKHFHCNTIGEEGEESENTH